MSAVQAVGAVARQEGTLEAAKALCGTWWDLWSQAHGARGICSLASDAGENAVLVLRGPCAVGRLTPVPGLRSEMLAEVRFLSCPECGRLPLV